MSERHTLLCSSCGGPATRAATACQYCGAPFADRGDAPHPVHALVLERRTSTEEIEFLARVYGQYPSVALGRYLRTPPALLQVADEKSRLEQLAACLREEATARGIPCSPVLRPWTDRIPYENRIVGILLAERLDQEKIARRLRGPGPRARIAFAIAISACLLVLSALVPWCVHEQRTEQAAREQLRMLRHLHPQPAAWLETLEPILRSRAPRWTLPPSPWRVEMQPSIPLGNAAPLQLIGLTFTYTGSTLRVDAASYALERLRFETDTGFSTNGFRALVADLAAALPAGTLRLQETDEGLHAEHPRCRIEFAARRDAMAVYERLLDRSLPEPPVIGYEIVLRFPLPERRGGRLIPIPGEPPSAAEDTPPLAAPAADDPEIRALLDVLVRLLAGRSGTAPGAPGRITAP